MGALPAVALQRQVFISHRLQLALLLSVSRSQPVKQGVVVALTRAPSSLSDLALMLSAVLLPASQLPSANFFAVRCCFCSTLRTATVRSAPAWWAVRRVSAASAPLAVLASSFERIMQTEGLSDSARDEICADAVVWASQHGLVRG